MGNGESGMGMGNGEWGMGNGNRECGMVYHSHPVPCSLFPVPCFLFPVSCSLFPMGPHDTQPTLTAGTRLDAAASACILVHGRGADPRDMAGLAQAFFRPGIAYLMPAAAGNTWYPFSFLSPRERNQQGIDSGLSVIEGLVQQCLDRKIQES